MVYLRTGGLPEDKDEREQLRHRAGHYTMLNNELFQRSANDTLMRCILPDEGCTILQDIHAGICGSHAGAHTVVGKNTDRGSTSPMPYLTPTPWFIVV
jgi:hypothetical protein